LEALMSDVCIALPGHSISRPEFTDVKDVTALQSSGLYQEIRYTAAGKEFPFVRTGIDKELRGNEKNAYLAGQQQVVRAGVQCFRYLKQFDLTAEFLLPAGRPDYIAGITDDPELCEGSIMERELRKNVGDDVRIAVHGTNRVTGDDVASVISAASGPYENVLVILMTFRIARFEVLLQEQNPAPSVQERIRVMAAETFVGDPVGFLDMTLTNAYTRSVRNERFGINAAIKTGVSATTGGKT
jgi:hypothetical protein